jgi:hypothetical protein
MIYVENELWVEKNKAKKRNERIVWQFEKLIRNENDLGFLFA